MNVVRNRDTELVNMAAAELAGFGSAMSPADAAAAFSVRRHEQFVRDLRVGSGAYAEAKAVKCVRLRSHGPTDRGGRCRHARGVVGAGVPAAAGGCSPRVTAGLVRPDSQQQTVWPHQPVWLALKMQLVALGGNGRGGEAREAHIASADARPNAARHFTTSEDLPKAAQLE